MTAPLFPLGQTVATPGALAVMARLGINPADLIVRHVTGDWGDICPEDRGLNEQALRDGSRIFSVYGKQYHSMSKTSNACTAGIRSSPDRGPWSGARCAACSAARITTGDIRHMQTPI